VQIERQLAGVLSDLARTLVRDLPIQAILEDLVGRAVEVLPVDAVGVTLIFPGPGPSRVAASDDSALQSERLQCELGEGPGLLAHKSGVEVGARDLRHDARFPLFGSRVAAAGLLAVFSFPLRQGEQRLGSLDLYRATAGPLDARARRVAQTLADVAAAYLLNAQMRLDLREASETALQRSLHDGLTGLPNRALLLQRIEHAVLRCRRSDKIVAILFADLDGFKLVNDTYGHQVGDELLVAVAGRLTGLLRPGDTLARLGGDELVVLCEDLDEAAQVGALALRLGDALLEPFVLSDIDIRVTASVGVAFAGRGDHVPEQLLQVADSAMYEAKRRGGGHHIVVDLRGQHVSSHRASLSRELHGAPTRGQLSVEYQPIVTLADGKVVAVEALLRWEHPTHGVVPPQTAIRLAEQASLVSEIGAWVLQQACLDRHRWMRSLHTDELVICVNVSAHQLMGAGFARSVEALLSRTDTNPELVTLEVTEGVFLQDNGHVLDAVNRLKQIGVRLALDDFGTGYSSLSYLKRLPVDVVKLDRVFIADLERDLASRLIVSAVVGLAHGLGITVVAEGVESVEQYRQVVALDCDSYQGFYFAHPMSADALAGLLVGDGEASGAEPLPLSADARPRG
jgi:diguanylate cyclase (GGDEF)-like protein